MLCQYDFKRMFHCFLHSALTLWKELINSWNISLRVRPSSSWGCYSKSLTSLNLPSCCILVFMKVYGARLRYFACQHWSCQASLRLSHGSSTTGHQRSMGSVWMVSVWWSDKVRVKWTFSRWVKSLQLYHIKYCCIIFWIDLSSFTANVLNLSL